MNINDVPEVAAAIQRRDEAEAAFECGPMAQWRNLLALKAIADQHGRAPDGRTASDIAAELQIATKRRDSAHEELVTIRETVRSAQRRARAADYLREQQTANAGR